VASPAGDEVIRGEASGSASEAEELGRALGNDLLDRGARRILDAVYI